MSEEVIKGLVALLGEPKRDGVNMIFRDGTLIVNVQAMTFYDSEAGEAGQADVLLANLSATRVEQRQVETVGSPLPWEVPAQLPDGLAEERELAALLVLDADRAQLAVEDVTKGDFMVGLHGAIFAVALRAAEAGRHLAIADLVEELGGDTDQIVAEGMPLGRYIAWLAAHAPQMEPGAAGDLVRQLARAVRNRALADDGMLPAEPEPYKTKFGPMFWGEHRQATKRYEWIIKGLVPAGKRMLIAGPSRSGKTFQAFDMAAHVALGRDYHGRKTKQLGVAYCFYESPDGAPQRLEAYCQGNGIDAKAVPFVMMLKPPQLFDDPKHARELAQEIKQITSSWAVPLGVIVLDTHNASTLGSSEIRSEDISRIIAMHRGLIDETGASLWIVGHTNEEGRHRGNAQLYNGVDTSIFIEKLETKDGFERDDAGRIIRQATLDKQREGKDDNVTWRFVLREIALGTDDEGDPITSMVVDRVANSRSEDLGDTTPQQARAAGAVYLRTLNEIQFFRALMKATQTKGMAASITPKAAANVPYVARFADVVECYSDLEPQKTGESDKDFVTRMNNRVAGVARIMRELRVIDTDTVHVDGDEPGKKVRRFVMWPTGRRVQGKGFVWPPMPQVVPASDPELGTDEAIGEPF